MTGDVTLAEVLAQLGPVTGVLDESIASAIAIAEERCRGLGSRFNSARSMMVRAWTRVELESASLAEGWTLAGDTNRMGQLIIRKPGVMDLRFLKGNPLQSGRVPHAGLGAARRAAWRQDPLPELWPTTAQRHTFLLLWDYLDVEARTEGFTLRVAHPISPGRFGHRVPCDLDIEIPRGGTMFEDLRFEAHDEEEDLFAVHIDSDEDLGQ